MTANQKMILGKSKTNNSFNEIIAQQKQKQGQIPVMGKTKAVGDMRNPAVAKNINKKIEESEIAKSAKQSTAANMQNSSAGQTQKECSNFCRKKGFNILPLRYTVVKDNPPALPATLGKNVKDIQLSHLKYAVEMIDTGYIYRLVKRTSGALEWAGYKVTPNGHLSYFPVGKEAPKSVPEFACKGAGHSFNSSVIAVESNPKDEAKIAYIIHTHVPMSKAKISEYEKNADKFVTEGKWQKILINGGSAQEHCIAASQFKTTVYNLNSFGKNRIDATLNKFKDEPKSLACMALYDPVGITRKLNTLRNSEFKKVMDFLAKKEGDFTNEHRLNSSQCIDSIKICLENRLLNERSQLSTQVTKSQVLMGLWDELPKNLTDADDINYELEKIYKRKSKEEQERLLKKVQEKQTANKGIYTEDMGKLSRRDGEQIWIQKYKPNLDMVAKSNFDKKINVLIQECLAGARAIGDDHIKWLLSKAVVNALHAYDDQVQVPYGNIFYVHAMDMINGMSGVPSGQALLETWLGVEKIAKENIYMRAICYNQESLKNKYNAAAPSIIDISWDDGQNAAKTVIAAFVAADKAWQEWAADKTNNVYMLHGQKFSLLKTFYWMSELTQSAVKWSMKYTPGSEFAKKLGRLTFYTFAHSGALVEHVAKNSLYYLIPVHTLTGRVKLTPEMVQNNWKKYSSSATNPSKAAKQIDRIIANSSPSAGLRVSGVVAIFELINLGTQISKFNIDPSVDNALSYMSGMMATTAAILEVGSSSMEKFSFAERAAYIAKCGAYFAIAGATVSLIIDLKNLGKSIQEGNYYAIALGLGKFVVSFLTLAVGVSVLLNLPLMKNTSLYYNVERYALGRAILGIRAVQAGAMLSIAGIALVALEIYLKNYVLDNAMQDWCQKCTFHLKTSAETPFKDIKEEEKEFNSAVVSI
ncbi:T6SS effector BTH_I2691 family protein [Acinetobacter nosocomialis]|uniref:T6SS effector BTH_I2691 family protein n=1 Tax=Acinetobacter nosocomialis TaxID=106654 RepID=UPI00270A8C5D|nr:T6SS effector BTH_I2691 family protein [Acinetobacter nosocomialis]MDO7195708.1 T6SS effector BTH_I2691 family protein [Acinetobacter nosocomialis]